MRAKTGRSTLPGAVPTVVQLEEELKRETYRKQYGRVLRSTIYILITVAAVAVLIATLWLPVLQIYGTSIRGRNAGLPSHGNRNYTGRDCAW